MFSRVADASKVALAHLCAKGYALIDCQVPSAHLLRMGARLIPRREFLAILAHSTVPRSRGPDGRAVDAPGFLAKRSPSPENIERDR